MRVLVYKLSIFGNFKAFEATSKNIINWTQELGNAGYDLLPNVDKPTALPVIPVPFYVGIPVPEDNRVSFIDPDGKFRVSILAERLDVEFGMEEINDVESNFKAKYEIAKKIIDVMLRILGDVRGTRLAFYTDIMIQEQGDTRLNNIYQKYNLGLSLGKREDECVEWSHRFNRRTKIGVSEDREELCNVVLAMETGVFQQINKNPEPGLRITADINTLMENSAERFTKSNFVYFTGESQDIFFNIILQIDKMIPGGELINE